jgi:hypothetical protein
MLAGADPASRKMVMASSRWIGGYEACRLTPGRSSEHFSAGWPRQQRRNDTRLDVNRHPILHVRHLGDRRHAVDDDDRVAPVGLIGLARREAFRS